MVAWITRILLVVQILIAAAIFFAVTRFSTLQSIPLAMLLSVGTVVLVRMLITANNFRLAWRYRSVTPEQYWLNWRQACRLFLEEFKATMLSSSWSMPFYAFTRRSMPDAHGLPVLLIHGYGCNSGYWHGLSQQLSKAKISHHAVSLEPVFGDIEAFVPAVHEAVEILCKDSRHHQIIIVAHSMGGLVARAYMCRHGQERIAKVITLGTPHHGTGLAHFGVGDNTMQMRWLGTAQDGKPSDWILKLCAQEGQQRNALFVSIYSHHDNIIAPQTSSHLEGARNIALHGIGHVALAVNAKVQKIVVEEILAITPLKESRTECSSSAPKIVLVDQPQ